MKILFITPFVPSKKAGGENFTRLLLDDLAKRHTIDLIYFKYSSDKDYIPQSNNIRIKKVIKNTTFLKLWNCIKVPFLHPIYTVRFRKDIVKLMQNLEKKEQYDLIYLDHSQTFLYGRFFKNQPKLLMAHDVMAQRFERSSSTFMKNWVCKSEKFCMNLPNATIFTFSDKDRQIIKENYNLTSHVTHFYLDPMIIEAVPNNIKEQIVFFGKWKRTDNFDGLKWFFDEVYTKISKNLNILIIGIGLPDSFIKQIKQYKNVQYLGFVENPYPLIANSLAVISPLFSGAGVKVKTVESLACGTPVIGNNITFEGIDNIFNHFMIKAETKDDYIQLLTNLNFSISDRKSYKTFFLSRYDEMSISSYLDKKNVHTTHKTNYQNQ